MTLKRRTRWKRVIRLPLLTWKLYQIEHLSLWMAFRFAWLTLK
jgi:hypothetical protein